MLSRLLFFIALFTCQLLNAQVVYTDPVFPHVGDQVTIYFDATQGTGGLADCNCDVYLHTGVITNLSSGPSDWKHVVTTWGVTNPAWKLTPVPGQPNLYSYVIGPSIQAYYGISVGEIVQELAFVFRNATGSLQGKDVGGADIFYPVYPDDFPFSALLLSPSTGALIKEIGETIDIRLATSEPATITLRQDGNQLVQVTGVALDYTLQVTETGTHLVEITADNGEDQLVESFTYTVPVDIPQADPPAGTVPGGAFIGDDAVRLALFAPNKEFVFVIGSFNDWTPSTEYQMTRSLDGNLHWLEIDGLEPGAHYTYQYLVSGGVKVADPYSTVVLDPWNDPFIPAVTYPDLPPYPQGASGIVTLIQPGAPQYNWLTNNFQRPPKEKLVIYELLLRDFIARHDYTTLIDTLGYLQRLGVNAIELMPVNEFEGNISWGYNPSFHMALDKYYGPINEFKRFVDECHARGIAVILDVVYNHAFSQSPLAQLYWDAANFRPAPDNPWLNVTPRHPFNVGYDFNHESQATKDFVEHVMRYWLTEFRIDGFRFDLSKGFTQTFSGDNVGLWGQYDASRIAILKRYADVMWETSPGSYAIMEHFADNTEEKELADYGMMLWGNINHDYNEATMGYNNSLSWGFYKTRNWNDPHLVTYMESHDEERLMYKNLQFGASATGYNIRDLPVGLDRVELASCFFYTIPGPKMLWQFGEVGYDFSINYCPNGTINNNCRVDPKPIRWDYYDQPDRRDLFNVTRALIHLKKNYEVFNATDVTHNLNNSKWKKLFLNHPEMRVAVLGNFDVLDQAVTAPFPTTGKWYEFFTGDSIQVTNAATPITLDAGEYRLYTNVRIPSFDQVTSSFEVVRDRFDLTLMPNPADGFFRIGYTLEQPGTARIDLYNIYGQYIANVFQGRQIPGPHLVEWSQPLPSGTYLVRLTVDGKVETKRVVVAGSR